MRFLADLHIHSKYSRATSRDCNLENLALWAMKKGIAVVGTGDFTHGAWQEELSEKLVPDQGGAFRLSPEIEKGVRKKVDPSLHSDIRFVLSAEISTIYKYGDKTRKVHHVVFAPDLGAARKMRKALLKIGNLDSDGRPILGLDSRDLLEIVLEAGDGCYLVPAHIWTPWFSAMGSKSGFDSISECYRDLAGHIHAVETGLSSDPPMNWMVGSLDGYRLVSNSDAHSPGKLGREANIFDTGVDYFSIKKAIETGEGYIGTVEFFPEEGKYHADGHRKCGVRMAPEETEQEDGLCPVCGKPVTVGVLNRVMELADRKGRKKPATAGEYRSFIPLDEVLAEIIGCGPKTKGVLRTMDALTQRLGPELFILDSASLDDISRLGSEELAEAIKRMRAGDVIKKPGFDGEYGVIKLFQEGELSDKKRSPALLFELPEEEKLPPVKKKAAQGKSKKPARKKKDLTEEHLSSHAPDLFDMCGHTGEGFLSGLDDNQRKAASYLSGPVLVTAGPGSGKTRTLTCRVATLVGNKEAEPEECLCITFTRKAAAEMSERLESILGEAGSRVPVMTFHALGHLILTEHGTRAGLPKNFRVTTDKEKEELFINATGAGIKDARKLLIEISRLKRENTTPPEDLVEVFENYEKELRARGLLDFDDLVVLAADLLYQEPELMRRYNRRWAHISIDEYQDMDRSQYRLARLLCSHNNICAIGDPDQSIYGFRGADPALFDRFERDFPGARVFRLSANYRSGSNIVEGAGSVIAASAVERERKMETLLKSPELITVHESASAKAEAEFVVHTIEDMMGGHAFFSMDSGRTGGESAGELSFSDFGVLFRTESQSGELVEAFVRSGIPFRKRGHGMLFDRPGVAEILGRLSGKNGKLSIALKDSLREMTENADSEDRKVYEDAFELIKEAASGSRLSPQAFATTVSLSSEVDALSPEVEAVSLLTLHASKGLEFKVVFITGCEDGIIPLDRGDAGRADIEEERRLFFVGMTRAMQKLYLTRAKKRMVYGKTRELAPSPFLSDIIENLTEKTTSSRPGKKRRPGAKQLDLF